MLIDHKMQRFATCLIMAITFVHPDWYLMPVTTWSPAVSCSQVSHKHAAGDSTNHCCLAWSIQSDILRLVDKLGSSHMLSHGLLAYSAQVLLMTCTRCALTPSKLTPICIWCSVMVILRVIAEPNPQGLVQNEQYAWHTSFRLVRWVAKASNKGSLQCASSLELTLWHGLHHVEATTLQELQCRSAWKIFATADSVDRHNKGVRWWPHLNLSLQFCAVLLLFLSRACQAQPQQQTLHHRQCM